MDSMSADSAFSSSIPLTQAAGTLRSLVGQLDSEQPRAVVIEERGEPRAVLVSFAVFQRLLESAGGAEAELIAGRLTSAPRAGEGLSNTALEQLVADARSGATGGDATG